MKKILLGLLCAFTLGTQAQVLVGNEAAAVFPNAVEVKVEEGNTFPSYIELDAASNVSEESFFAILSNQFLPSTKFSFSLLNSNVLSISAIECTIMGWR